MNTTLRASVKDPSDVERQKGRTYFDHSVIPFIPEKRDETMGKDEFVELQLRVNRDLINGSIESNLVKKRVKIFSHGSIEDLLLWKIDVEDAMTRKPCSSGKAMFGMVEMLLRGDPLHTWRELREKETSTIQVGGDLQGDTIDAFQSTMRRFFSHYFPKHISAARRQKSYMQKGLFKPHSVTVSQVVSRLRVLNSFLPFVPGPENSELDEGALIDIVVGMCLARWRNEMLRIAFEPHEHTLDQVQNKLELYEVMEEVDNTHLGPDGKCVVPKEKNSEIRQGKAPEKTARTPQRRGRSK